ncbi:uncharacterized protein METZ01_LOCUS298317, partial [marine metagenome]
QGILCRAQRKGVCLWHHLMALVVSTL